MKCKPGGGFSRLFSKKNSQVPVGLTSSSDGRIPTNNAYSFTSNAQRRDLMFYSGMFRMETND